MVCIALSWLANFLVYQMDLFGRVEFNRGIFCVDVQLYAEPAVLALYLYYFCAGKERPFCLYLIFKFSRIILVLVSIAYAFDVILYWIDPEMFCTL